MNQTHYTPKEVKLLEYIESHPPSVPKVKERRAFIKNAVLFLNF